MLVTKKKIWRMGVLLPVILALLLTGCGGRRTSAEKRVSNRRGGETQQETQEAQTRETRRRETEPPETAPRETEPPETAPRETEPAETKPRETTPPAPEPEETKAKENHLIYDARKSAYTASNPEWQNMHFSWKPQRGEGTLEIDVPVDLEMFRYYQRLERYLGLEDYYKYVNDPQNLELMQTIVDEMRQVMDEKNYDDADAAREIAKFVQDVVEYEYDDVSTGMDEYPRYPIETLCEGQGDCEDTSILMAGLLKLWGYDVGLLHLPGHLTVAIRTSDDYQSGSYYEFNGHRYLYIESTGSGWKIGQIPEEMHESAQLYPIP